MTLDLSLHLGQRGVARMRFFSRQMKPGVESHTLRLAFNPPISMERGKSAIRQNMKVSSRLPTAVKDSHNNLKNSSKNNKNIKRKHGKHHQHILCDLRVNYSSKIRHCTAKNVYTNFSASDPWMCPPSVYTRPCKNCVQQLPAYVQAKKVRSSLQQYLLYNTALYSAYENVGFVQRSGKSLRFCIHLLALPAMPMVLPKNDTCPFTKPSYQMPMKNPHWNAT